LLTRALGAAVGVFTGLGILILSILGIFYVGWSRRQQKYLKRRRSKETDQSDASLTFSAIMRRLDANPAHQASDTLPKVSVYVQQTVTRSPPQRISLSSLSEWWIRRKERGSSQFNQILHGGGRTSIIDDDIKRPGEETQWALGKFLEDQRKRVITPPTPASLRPITQPNFARRIIRRPGSNSSRSSRGGRSVGESEGGDFTLEDALLSSLSSFSSLHIPYELGSSRSGRHPYARAQG
jgi:hypothetical protein